MTNVNVSRETHPRPPTAAGIAVCVITPLSVNNRAAEGGRAAVVRAVVADGAGGGSGVKVCTDVGDVGDGGGAHRNETNDPCGTTARTKADRPPVITPPKVNNRATGAHGGASRRGRSLFYPTYLDMPIFLI